MGSSEASTLTINPSTASSAACICFEALFACAGQPLGRQVLRFRQVPAQLLPAHLCAVEPEHAEADRDMYRVACDAGDLAGEVLALRHLAVLLFRTAAAAALAVGAVSPLEPGAVTTPSPAIC